MSNERWQSPFLHTIAYNLYKKHVRELNKIYWAYVPATNTIKKAAKKALVHDDADPKTYFLIKDEDDRRVATSYAAWKDDYRMFENYTRLNMIMLISSCFETYLRTIVSQSFESRPGVIIMCPESVDGAFLFKNRTGYGNGNSKDYQFTDQIDEVCRGEWSKRLSAFKKYFGSVPAVAASNESTLDEYRVLRNNIAHYLGRKKKDYTAPLLFSPMDAIEVSHDRVIKYFKLVNDVANDIDLYLKEHFIGSYDIIKFYYQQVSAGRYDPIHQGERANNLRIDLGREGMRGGSRDYFRNIVTYCELENSHDVCRYNKRACINSINRKLSAKNVAIIREGHKVPFSRYHLNLFVKANQWHSNPEYCKINPNNANDIEYCYSMRLIDQIVDAVSRNPDTIILSLQKKVYPSAEPTPANSTE